MKLIGLFLLLSVHSFAGADAAEDYASMTPSQINKNNLTSALQNVVMGKVIGIKNYTNDSISFSVLETSAPNQKKVDTFTCPMTWRPGAMDIKIPACSGTRTINGESDSKTPTLTDISRRGESLLVLHNIVDPSEKVDHTSSRPRSYQTPSVAPQEGSGSGARDE